MSMKVNSGLSGMFRYGRSTTNAGGNAPVGSRTNASGGAPLRSRTVASEGVPLDARTNARSVRRLLSEADKQEAAQGLLSGNPVSSTLSYSDTIRASREKAKETSLKLKKLRYSFKSISTQILRSKTSVSAKQVAAKARREVIRLKRQKQNGEYDEEELQAAITHAEAMERVAKKKARHLQEEELVKVTGGPCMGDLEEKEDQKPDKAAAEDAVAAFEEGGRQSADPLAEQSQAAQEATQAQMDELRAMMQAQMEQMQQMMELQTDRMQRQVSESMEDMMDEFTQSMEDLMEESGLEDLADSMFAVEQPEMDPADYKMMKLKHRLKEMKAIAEADSEYLKAIFDQLEKAKNSGMPALSGSGQSAGGFGGFSGMSAGSPSMASAGTEAMVRQINASVGGGAGGAVPEASAGMSVDISV